jgi:RHS repeat-associated protein
VWDGQVLLAMVDHTNGLVASFARGLDLSGSIQGAGGVGGVLAVNIATNGVHFAAFDGNGNLSALVSTTNGAVTADYEYSPFGETLRANGVVAKANPIRFSTQFADDVTGDVKYLFRDYQASVGRWKSRDPIEEEGGSALYALTENAPQDVSGRSKPAREGQMKTGHFESGIAQRAAKAAQVRDEPTQREPATFHRHAGGQRLVGAQDSPRTGHAPGDRRPVFAPA